MFGKACKWSIIILSTIGFSLTGSILWFIRQNEIKTIKISEESLIGEIARVVTQIFMQKIGQSILPGFLEVLDGNITRSEFEIISTPLAVSDFGSTSVGWVQMVESRDRVSFELFANTQYPERFYEIKTMNSDLDIVPKPVDNETIWPMLYTNPLSDRFLGVDFNVIWGADIETMVSSRDTVLTPGFSTSALGGLGFFLGELSKDFDETIEDIAFMTFSPAYSIYLECIGFIGKLLLPRGIIIDTLDSLSPDIKNIEFSVFTKYLDTVLPVMDLNTPIYDFPDFTMEDTYERGTNNYKIVMYVYDRDFIFIMSSDTTISPVMYILVGVIGFVSTLAVCLIITRQIEISAKNKEMAICAKTASASKSLFLAEMSHELKTPINGIIGTVDILRSFEISDDISKYLEDIESCSDILLSNISEILDITKIETGNMTFNTEEENLVDFITSVSRIMNRSYKKPQHAKDVEFIVNIEKSVPISLVTGDISKMRQVIMNLVSNAFKFTDSGFIKMNISCNIVENNGSTYIGSVQKNMMYIRIEVSDTGVGMSEEKMSKLFQPFSQLHTGRSDVGGSGLGLKITKSICESMGGKINCKSSPGGGTTFETIMVFGVGSDIFYNRNEVVKKFSLGGESGSHSSHSIRGSRDNSDSFVNYNSRGSRTNSDSVLIRNNRTFSNICRDVDDTIDKRWVLLVDDISINRNIARFLLAKLDVNVDVACDGVHSIDMCSRRKYSLIFMDYYMPGMTGADATRVIRISGMNRDTPIVALTASESSGVIDSISEAGMNGTLFKPVTFDLLRDAYNKYVN